VEVSITRTVKLEIQAHSQKDAEEKAKEQAFIQTIKEDMDAAIFKIKTLSAIPACSLCETDGNEPVKGSDGMFYHGKDGVRCKNREPED